MSTSIITDGWAATAAHKHQSGRPCEDSVFTSPQVAVLADGCSSCAHAALGATLWTRLWTRALQEALTASPDDFLISPSKQSSALTEHLPKVGPLAPWQAPVLTKLLEATHQHWERMLFEMGVASEEALCTSGTLIQTPQGTLVHWIGDGTIAHVGPDGALWSLDIQSLSGAPQYPSYLVQGTSLLELWRKSQPVCKLDFQWQDSMGLDGSWKSLAPLTTSWLTPLLFFIPNAPNSHVAGFSDGLSALGPLPERMEELLQFKNTAPGFFNRRMSRAVSGWKQQGDTLVDDLSGVIMSYLPTEETK